MDNPTKHHITLKGRTVLEHLQQVKSLSPPEVKLKETLPPSINESPKADIQGQCTGEGSDQSCQEQPRVAEEFKSKEEPCSYIPHVDTEELSEEQDTIVRKMLEEEAESFSKTDDDVRMAEKLQVDINFTDSASVQRKYTAIPRPFHVEVKQYVEDLLN